MKTKTKTEAKIKRQTGSEWKKAPAMIEAFVSNLAESPIQDEQLEDGILFSWLFDTKTTKELPSAEFVMAAMLAERVRARRREKN